MRTDVSSVREIPEMHTMGHTCANLNGELLFVWGGTNERVAYLAIKNSSIWIYETLTGYWRHRICSGECPPYLSGCASCLIGQKMYIFGGHSTVQDNWLNCLYCLDLETFIWSDLGAHSRAQPAKPIRSDKNVAWGANGRLYIFGGYGWSQIEHYLELLDCQKDLQLVPDHRWPKFGWNNQLVEYNPADHTWRWPNYTGKCPSARAAHAGALMDERYFVFGGRDSHERLNDLHTFNMRTFDWQQVAVVTHESGLVCHISQPIGHLLDDEHRPTAIAAPVAERDRMQLTVDERDDVDENHRQIVAEMHEVGVDEETVWGVPAASTSAAGMSQTMPDISSDQMDVHFKPASDGINATDASAELDDDDFEYPHPSHLLERWSLSSTSQEAPADLNHCQASPQNRLQLDHSLSVSQQRFGGVQPVSSDPLHLSQSQVHEQQLCHQQELSTNQEQEIGLQSPSHLDCPSDEIETGSGQQATSDSALFSVPPPPASANNQDHQEHIARQTASSINLPAAFPPGRSFCSLTPVSSDHLLLFGGVNSQDENLDDCWLFNVTNNRWTRIDYTKLNHRLMRPRLWHTGSRTKQNEVVIIGGSCSDKIDEYCSDVLLISFEPRSLKRIALDTVSRAVRMKTIQRTRDIPSTLIKLIKLRKQAMALTTYRQEPATNNQAR